LDKNGEELTSCNIKSISCDEKGLVELLDGSKHNLEDGDEVHFVEVSGMQLIEGKEHPGSNKDLKSASINETIWKVKNVITTSSFTIGDTTMYTAYKA